MKIRLILLAWLLTNAALITFNTGCESAPPRPRQRDHSAMGAMPGAPAKPIAMQGENTFFAGQLTVRIAVAQGIAGMPEDSRGRPPGFGGRPSGGDEKSMERESDRDLGIERASADTGMPRNTLFNGGPLRMNGQSGEGVPLSLGLSLVNNAKEGTPIDVEIVEFASALGNFAMKPDHIALAPGQTGGPRSVVSRLGLTTEELVVKVTLRLADKKESQQITLRRHEISAPAAAGH